MGAADPMVFVGVDWSTEHHDACAVDANGKELGKRRFKHGGAGLTELAEWLSAQSSDPATIAIAIEVPRGPVVETLLERGFQVFSLNPKQMDRFRDRFSVAGAKDDRFDARVLADSLRTDRPCFRPLRVDDPLVINLREMSRMTDELQEERTRMSNRIREQIWRYFPQMLELTDDVASDWFLELWELVQTPAQVAKLRSKDVKLLLRKYRIRRLDAEAVQAKLGEPALRVSAGTVEAAVGYLGFAVARLKLANEQLRTAHRRLDQLCEELAAEGQKTEQRDVAILQSLPGVGRIVLATLLAEASEPLRSRDYHALRTLCGVAPVTRSSGKTRLISMRKACIVRLQTAMYHWSRVAVQHDAKSRAKYAALRSRGHSHARALRTVADRLLEMMCTMLRKGTDYDPERRAALQELAPRQPARAGQHPMARSSQA